MVTKSPLGLGDHLPPGTVAHPTWTNGRMPLKGSFMYLPEALSRSDTGILELPTVVSGVALGITVNPMKFP